MRNIITLAVSLLAIATVFASGPQKGHSHRPIRDEVTATIGFGFDIVDLQTDHQFPGQKNTLHVSYQYGTLLRGGGFDPSGHKVGGDTFPYFQQVRDGIVSYIRSYKDKNNFYELFGNDIARHVMDSYPQIASLDMTMEVPAFGGVQVDRRMTLHLERKKR